MFGLPCDGCTHLKRRSFGWRRVVRSIGIQIRESEREIIARYCKRIYGLWLRAQDERWPGVDNCGPGAKYREIANV